MHKKHEILRLVLGCGLSHRAAAASCRVSPTTVGQVVSAAAAAGLGWPLPAGLSASELVSRLAQGGVSAGRSGSSVRSHPDWQKLSTELKKKGVTRRLLWEEYRREHADGYSYSQFCELFRVAASRQNPTMRFEHRFGEKLFVDWAGQTIRYGDREAYLFVGVLGASNYTFAQVYKDMRMGNWLQAHIDCFNFLGGVPSLLVPDNTKTAVTRPCFYDPDVNQSYTELAQYYGCAVLPTRVRKPRDKAKVEGGVLHAERRILAALRDCQFKTLQEARRAVSQKLAELNDGPFEELEGSRESVFQSEERPVLKGLPAHEFCLGIWKQHKVDIDYHVQVEYHYYSVPYEHIGKTADVRVSERVIECYVDGVRVATHKRSYQRGRATTEPSHRPPQHSHVVEDSLGSLLERAAERGQACLQVAERMSLTSPHPEMSFRSIRGLLRLHSKYGPARVEAACCRALEADVCRYRHIRSMLDNHLEGQHDHSPPIVQHRNIRGAVYYQNLTKEENQCSPNRH